MSELKRSTVFWNVLLTVVSTVLILVLGDDILENLIKFLALNSILMFVLLICGTLNDSEMPQIFPFSCISFWALFMGILYGFYLMIEKINKLIDGK